MTSGLRDAPPDPGAPSLWPLILRITGPATCFETAAWSLLPVLTIAAVQSGFGGIVVGLVGGALPAGLIAMLLLLSNEARFRRYATMLPLAARIHPVLILLMALAMRFMPGDLFLVAAGGLAFLTGCVTALVWVGSDAVLLVQAPRQAIGKAVTLHEIVRSCGLGLGPLTIALLGGEPLLGMAFVLALATAGLVLATFLPLPPGTPAHEAFEAPARPAGRAMPAIILLAGFGGFLEAIEATEFPAYALALGATAAIAAGFAAAAGLGNLVGQLALGVAIDRHPRAAFNVTGLLIPLGLVLFALVGGKALSFGPLALLGAASGVLYTLAVIITASTGTPQGLVARAALAYTTGAALGPPLGSMMSQIDQRWGMPTGLILLSVAIFLLPSVRHAATRAAATPE
jgi:hypothetical protein